MASSEGKTIFVGDGINDALCWRVAMLVLLWEEIVGRAIEVKQMVIMGDEISKVPQAILIAQKTMISYGKILSLL